LIFSCHYWWLAITPLLFRYWYAITILIAIDIAIIWLLRYAIDII
jgi:hypothetical protein